MVAHRQERGCGRQPRECSRVDRISGRTNGRRKRTKSRSKTSVVPVSYSCRTKIIQAVLDRQGSGVKATIWWFYHDHDRSGRSAMIGNIGKEWSAQCDLAPVPLTRFRSNSKFDHIWQCSGFKCALLITTKFCTCHDSVTVVTCAKFRCDWWSIFQTRALPILIEFRIRSKYR